LALLRKPQFTWHQINQFRMFAGMGGRERQCWESSPGRAISSILDQLISMENRPGVLRSDCTLPILRKSIVSNCKRC